MEPFVIRRAGLKAQVNVMCDRYKLFDTSHWSDARQLENVRDLRVISSHAGCTLHEADHVWYAADWRRQTEDQKKRTEQVILDTSAREAELLLRNRELTQEVVYCSKLSDALFPSRALQKFQPVMCISTKWLTHNICYLGHMSSSQPRLRNCACHTSIVCIGVTECCQQTIFLSV